MARRVAVRLPAGRGSQFLEKKLVDVCENPAYGNGVGVRVRTTANGMVFDLHTVLGRWTFASGPPSAPCSTGPGPSEWCGEVTRAHTLYGACVFFQFSKKIELDDK